MPAHRFTLLVDGETLHGIAFADEAELLDFMTSRASLTTAPAIATPAIETPRPAGRPSHDQQIAAAVAELGAKLRKCGSIAGQARTVLKHLATAGAEIPARRTVERYFTDHPMRQNSRQNSRQKHRRAKVAAIGG